ncbi:histone H3-like centromeric protein a [Anaeramoeba flamelloides]|uniref:Histone H3-like centromeric protein a n=1 Tax=Anaeramoeba flamelloides TaxID=1746091 RepID=A0ABQ8XCW4_9EUKA|nr:histone H3-like centromeric protein a [Anaeramoeba flamelloides]
MTRDKQKKKRTSSSESSTESTTLTSGSSSTSTKKSSLPSKKSRRTKGKGRSKGKGRTKKSQKGKKSLKGGKGLKGLKGLKGRKGLKGMKSPYSGKKRLPLSQIVQKRQSGKKYRPGRRAIKEIVELQKTTHMLMRKLPFARCVRSIARDCFTREHNELRWQKNAILCLQEATEKFIIDFLSDMNLCAIHGKRVTIMDRDAHLVQKLTSIASFQK